MVGGLLAALAGLSAISSMMAAEQTLTSTEQPMQLKLTTSLKVETAHYGDHFEGQLVDSYQLNGKSLPAGTLFKGHVERAHKSMPFGMPGYVVLEIDEAQMPSGTIHHFDHDGPSPKSDRIMNPKARSGKKLFKDNLPYTIISTATSIPLKYAAGMSSGVILPIAMGGRIATGIAMQLKNHHNQPDPKTVSQPTSATSPTLASSVGQGIMQGSGLTSAYYFLTAAPEPILSEGSVIPLHFRSQDMADLFSAGETSATYTEATILKPTPTTSGHAEAPVSTASGNSVSPEPPKGLGKHLTVKPPDSAQAEATGMVAQPDGK